MKISVIPISYHLGRRLVSIGRGPEHLLRASVLDFLRDSGHDVRVDPIEAEPFTHEIGMTFELNARLAGHVRSSVAEGRLPLVLAGDCNSCLGTLSGLNLSEVGVIWFDAHGDFNTPEMTATGFFDGMALATAVGRCWTTLSAMLPGFQPIAERRVMLVGARALDQDEERLLEESRVRLIRSATVRTASSESILTTALDDLRRECEAIYVHLDFDVLDPGDLRANHWAEPDGLSLQNLRDILRLLPGRFRIAAIAMTAYDPAADIENKGPSVAATVLKELMPHDRTKG